MEAATFGVLAILKNLLDEPLDFRLHKLTARYEINELPKWTLSFGRLPRRLFELAMAVTPPEVNLPVAYIISVDSESNRHQHHHLHVSVICPLHRNPKQTLLPTPETSTASTAASGESSNSNCQAAAATMAGRMLLLCVALVVTISAASAADTAPKGVSIAFPPLDNRYQSPIS